VWGKPAGTPAKEGGAFGGRKMRTELEGTCELEALPLKIKLYKNTPERAEALRGRALLPGGGGGMSANAIRTLSASGQNTG